MQFGSPGFKIGGAGYDSPAFRAGDKGAAFGTGGGGGVTPLPAEAVSVWLGDSQISQSVCSFMKSQQLQTLIRAGGRMILAQAGDKGIGGTRLVTQNVAAGDPILDRVPRVVEQRPAIIFVEGGHNDNPGASPSTVIADQRTVQTALRTQAGSSVYIVWQTKIPTSVEGVDSTKLANLATVNADRMALDGTDGGKTLCVDVSTGFDYTTMTYSESAGTVRVHPNEKGARFIAERILTKIAPILPASSLDDILGDVLAANDHGANLASAKWALPGTGGAVSNLGGGTTTGQVANTMLVTNNTTAAVVCSKEVVGAYEKQVIEITGTVTTEGSVFFGDGTLTNRTTLNALPGEYFEGVFGRKISHTDGVSAPVGVRSYGGLLPLGVAGYSLANYAAADANSGNDIDAVVEAGISRTQPKIQPTAFTLIQNSFGVRLAAGTVNVRLELWKPIVRKLFTTAKYAPIYVGDDLIKGTTERLGLSSGTVANGNVLTFRPGAWLGGGLSFGGLRIYKGGSSGGASAGGSTNGGSAGIGTGTLLATLTAGTWTWTAAGLTSGDQLYVELDTTNSFGTTTARSVAAIAVP